MFQAVFELVFAYMQVMYVLVGGACSGIGLLLIGYAIYQRLRERSVSGEIVAVRKDDGDKGVYWPVVSYSDAQGVHHETMASAGSSDIAGRAPGTKVEVLDAPTGPMLTRDWWSLVAIGAFFAVVGSPFLWIGLRQFRLNWETLLVVTAVIATGGFKLMRFVHRLIEDRKSGVLASQRDAFLKRREQRQALPNVSTADVAAAKQARAKALAAARPYVTVIGLVLFLGAGVWLQHQISFIATSASAKGVVVTLEESSSSNSTSYYPVVRFVDRRGDTHEFRDSVGSSPPQYEVGEWVTVLYQAQDPRRSMIDRGVWNWLLLVIACAVGFLLFGAGLRGYWPLWTRQRSLGSQTS